LGYGTGSRLHSARVSLLRLISEYPVVPQLLLVFRPPGHLDMLSAGVPAAFFSLKVQLRQLVNAISLNYSVPWWKPCCVLSLRTSVQASTAFRSVQALPGAQHRVTVLAFFPQSCSGAGVFHLLVVCPSLYACYRLNCGTWLSTVSQFLARLLRRRQWA